MTNETLAPSTALDGISSTFRRPIYFSIMPPRQWYKSGHFYHHNTYRKTTTSFSDWPTDWRVRQSQVEFIQQVTRGHNIVADGWVGASNPPDTLKHTKKNLNRSFSSFQLYNLRRTNGPTDGRTRPLIEQLKTKYLVFPLRNGNYKPCR